MCTVEKRRIKGLVFTRNVDVAKATRASIRPKLWTAKSIWNFDASTFRFPEVKLGPHSARTGGKQLMRMVAGKTYFVVHFFLAPYGPHTYKVLLPSNPSRTSPQKREKTRLYTLWKKDMRKRFPQTLFIYYYWEFKKLVIFKEIVRNISASGIRCKIRNGFRCKMRYY
jgi:hypothetical protein